MLRTSCWFVQMLTNRLGSLSLSLSLYPSSALVLHPIYLLSAPKLLLERAGPVSLKTFFPELIAFRLIPDICSARRAKPENDWIRQLPPGRAYPAIKSVILQKFIPGNMFPDAL